MTVISALVLFCVIWFVALLVALPIGLKTQEEAGEVVPGTPASAPVEPMIRRKLIWVTAAALLIWAAVCAVILWGGIGVRDLDFFHRMGPDTGS
jgi:predicted secreted protein